MGRLFTLGAFCALAATVVGQEQMRMEYFFDSDPGHGQAISLTAPLGEGALSIDASKLTPGAHQLCLRAQSGEGVWSPTMARMFYVYKVKPTAATAMEYFLDSDPGLGLGTRVAVSTGENTLALDLHDVKPGVHQLCLRSQDNEGAWSSTTAHTLYVYKARPTACVAMEYFLDSDPGHGLGTKVAVGNGENTLALDLGSLEMGAHQLCLRVQDNEGVWSPVMARTFYLCESRGFKALEYYFDDSDPGQGLATAISVPTEWTDEFSFDVSIDGLEAGNHYINVRGMDKGGQWSVVSREPFTIAESAGVTSVTFDMAMAIKAGAGVVTLSGAADGTRGDCRVEVYALDGTAIALTEWPASSPQIAVSTAASVVIVKVTDLANGKQLVRRIMMK